MGERVGIADVAHGHDFEGPFESVGGPVNVAADASETVDSNPGHRLPLTCVRGNRIGLAPDYPNQCYAERRARLGARPPLVWSATSWRRRRRWFTADLESFIRLASSPRLSSGLAVRHCAISRRAGGSPSSFPVVSSRSIAAAWRRPEPM